MNKIETSHRLVNLRVRSAGCSCGVTHEGDGSADLRAQREAHNANPEPARKVSIRNAAAKATTTVKPRPRNAVAK